MVVIDVYAHELAQAACTTQLSKVVYEACRIPCEADDRAVYVHNVGVWAVDLGPCRRADVYESGVVRHESRHEKGCTHTFDPEHVREANDRLFIHISGDMRH